MTTFSPALLQLAREIRGLTQQELAAVSGIDQGAISRYENGMKPITDEALNVLAAALDFPLEFFIRPYDPPPVIHIDCKHGWIKMDGRLK